MLKLPSCIQKSYWSLLLCVTCSDRAAQLGSTPTLGCELFYQNNYTDEQKIDLDFCDTDNKI